MGVDQYDQYDQSLEEDGLDRDCGTSNSSFPIFESPRIHFAWSMECIQYYSFNIQHTLVNAILDSVLVRCSNCPDLTPSPLSSVASPRIAAPNSVFF